MAEIGRKQGGVVTWEPEGFEPVVITLRPVTALDELRLDEAVKSVGPEATKLEQYRATAEVMADAVLSWSLKETECTRENVLALILDYSELYSILSRAFMGKAPKKKSTETNLLSGVGLNSSTPGLNAESTTTEARGDLTVVTTSTG